MCGDRGLALVDGEGWGASSRKALLPSPPGPCPPEAAPHQSRALWRGRGKAGSPGGVPAAERGAHAKVHVTGGPAAEAGERIQGLRAQPGEEVGAGQGQVGRLLPGAYRVCREHGRLFIFPRSSEKESQEIVLPSPFLHQPLAFIPSPLLPVPVSLPAIKCRLDRNVARKN